MKQWVIRLVFGHLILLSLGAGFAAYQLGWFKPWFSKQPVQIVNIMCNDLSLGCSFKIDQQIYSIKSNQPINTSQPVNLTLQGPAQSIRLSWQMLGMEMGNNYYKMLSDDQKTWRAETMLPICSQQRLDWLLTLEIDQNRILLQTQSETHK